MEISGEDKQILNEEILFYVRSYIRRKKPSAEIIKIVEELLKEGADINARDTKDNNNTILHIAAHSDEKDLVIYLMENGANLLSNSKGKTALDIALQRNTTLGKQIAEFISNSENISNNQQSAIKQIQKEKRCYQKRPGISSMSSLFYETKLISLLFYRAFHDQDVKEFYLGSNIDGIGQFDDICFRYENVACFIQVKHKINIDISRFTVDSIKRLGLDAYFDSFLKIRQKFSLISSDPMFYGTFEDIDSYFILYTPLKESFERKMPINKLVCRKLHNIIFTGYEETDIFQFEYEERDLTVLAESINQERLKILGKTFLKLILSNNNNFGDNMTDDLMKVYHPALAQKVVSIWKVLEPGGASNAIDDIPNCILMGKFKSEFFTSEDPNIILLNYTICEEIVLTYGPKVNHPKEEIEQRLNDIVKNPCAETISKLVGSIIKLDYITDTLILDISKLPKNKFNSDEISKIQHNLKNIKVTKKMFKDAVLLAGQKELESLTFRLPRHFGNIDITINKKNKEGIHKRLDFLAGKFNLLISHFADRNKNKQTKIIDISNDNVGPGKILEYSHLNSNGGIGGTVGNLLQFDDQSNLFIFNTETKLEENSRYVLNKIKEKSGEDLTNYKIKVLVDGFPKISFDVLQYDRKLAAEFFNKLWFYTNQAQEMSVGEIIKKEMHEQQRHSLKVPLDSAYLCFHDAIQKWWQSPTAHYLTKDTDLLENARTGHC